MIQMPTPPRTVAGITPSNRSALNINLKGVSSQEPVFLRLASVTGGTPFDVVCPSGSADLVSSCHRAKENISVGFDVRCRSHQHHQRASNNRVAGVLALGCRWRWRRFIREVVEKTEDSHRVHRGWQHV